ncbi:MAG: RNase adapter RapZ [Proteobacteria bacterium]|nr:RNase adapter RapZ [Pseudomonadota bacterium]MYJ95771.1 RNase adapter RapZ [Pseudomonadota bacterium]
MRLVVLSGLSGSGKSVALNALEDAGYYCIDNIPVTLLQSFVDETLPQQDPAFRRVALCADARNAADIPRLPLLVQELRKAGIACEVIFLQAGEDVLLSRFSETRRKHPLTTDRVSLTEALERESRLLETIVDIADLVVDTSTMNVHELRGLIVNRVASRAEGKLSILLESFGFKHGLPADADFVFDVRCLPNPYWEPGLRPLTGRDRPVKEFLGKQPQVQAMVDDIAAFLKRWIPRYKESQRAYLTVAIGCTGGRHRSVHVAEAVAARLSSQDTVQTRHHQLP